MEDNWYMPYINLSGKRGKGHRTLVDDSTFKRYGHLAWHLSNTGYAVRRTSEGTIRLHRLVAGTPEGLYTDHLNHDRLDNRACNLRVVTQAENMANYKGAKGYCWDASKKKWMVKYRGKFYGRYDTEEQAQHAYKLARSGIPYKLSTHPRRKYLPKGVFYMKSQRGNGKRFYIRPMLAGKRYFQGYFSTIEEAEEAYRKFFDKEK